MCMHAQDNVSYQKEKIATIFANQFHVFFSDWNKISWEKWVADRLKLQKTNKQRL